MKVRNLPYPFLRGQPLKKFPSLKSYFLSEGFSDARFKRLKEAFSNPLLEPVLLFDNASIQPFTQFNKLLQRSESTVHVLQTSNVDPGQKDCKPHC